MDKDFIRPEDILNKSQHHKYKNSIGCLRDGCENGVSNWHDLTCQEHEKEQVNKYQKCCQDECYNLIKNQNGKWARCSECREKHKSDNDVEIKEDFKADFDGRSIQYNELSCKKIVETLKAFSELNKVDIDDFSILKSTYDPKNGSMTFSIKIN